jgi:hypothetical protein
MSQGCCVTKIVRTTAAAIERFDRWDERWLYGQVLYPMTLPEALRCKVTARTTHTKRRLTYGTLHEQMLCLIEYVVIRMITVITLLLALCIAA